MAWTVSNAPVGATFNLYYRLRFTDPTTGLITDQETGSRTSITSPYDLAASIDLVTKGSSGWQWADFSLRLTMYDGATPVTSEPTDHSDFGIYTP
jgi:hypothetical protein